MKVPKQNYNEEQTVLAFEKLKKLREEFGENVATFKNVTYESLQRSPSLRSLILDYKYIHFYAQEKPKGSMIKENITEIDKI